MGYGNSDVWYSFDEERLGDFRGFTFDAQTVNLYDREKPRSETILNRPLHGAIITPYTMWNKKGLLPEAFIEQTDNNCIQVQLHKALSFRVTRRQKTVERQFTWDELYENGGLVDQAMEKRYPGKPMGPSFDSPIIDMMQAQSKCSVYSGDHFSIALYSQAPKPPSIYETRREALQTYADKYHLYL